MKSNVHSRFTKKTFIIRFISCFIFSQLAAGLDKVRNDVSLLVWDINVQLSK